MADVEETIQAFTEVKEKLDKQVYSLDDFANSARSKA
jgi:hypothetical protein